MTVTDLTRRAALLGGISLLAACGSREPRFLTYTGPQVTSVVVHKGRRQMQLFHFNQVLETYRFQLGWAPTGHKRFEGDGKTPEGQYWIDRRNPRSRFHLSLGISYPNEADIEYARSQGRPPGGDIFIHGTPDEFKNEPDWTWGCIAVTNKEIEVIYSMVRDGTPIFLNP